MIQNYHQQKLARWGGRHLPTSSPRQSDKNTSSKNRQDGEDDIRLLPLQELFQQKIDQMGRTTFSLLPPQGTKNGVEPKPIKGVRLS